MLTHLFISNYALIDELELQFESGLTTITGETGAGKSILLGALRLVLGERADLNSIKHKTEKCIIEATFDISNLKLQSFFDENNLDYEDSTIFRREILPSGKSRTFVNDVPTKLNVLNSLSSKLIDIHSQFETANLLTAEFQFEWLDAVANQQKYVNEFNQLLSDYQTLKNTCEKLKEEKNNHQKELDYNQFLFNELENAQLEDFSVEDLEKEQNLLENAENTAISLSEASQIMDSDELGILALLTQLQAKSKFFANYLPDSDLKERINSITIEANDISAEINNYLQEIEADPHRLQEVQSKLNQLNTLLQKHQVLDLEELIEIRDNLNIKIKKSFSLEDEIETKEKEISEKTKQLEKLALSIRKNRLKVIPKIQAEVISTLKELGMPDAQLEFSLENDAQFNSYGKDKVNLLFTANKGMALKTLDKSASGGERSRLMLAIKESVSKNKNLPTLILDEIDTGVSGKVAGSIGAVMNRLGKYMQVIAITHLPQVAAYGITHLKVKKLSKDNTTITTVTKLSHDERVVELAQIMSGDVITDAAKKQAIELLKENKI